MSHFSSPSPTLPPPPAPLLCLLLALPPRGLQRGGPSLPSPQSSAPRPHPVCCHSGAPWSWGTSASWGHADPPATSPLPALSGVWGSRPPSPLPGARRLRPELTSLLAKLQHVALEALTPQPLWRLPAHGHRAVAHVLDGQLQGGTGHVCGRRGERSGGWLRAPYPRPCLPPSLGYLHFEVQA